MTVKGQKRWKCLHPDEVPVPQARREMQKAARIRNFVDQEQERPALASRSKWLCH
ncbi:hypothetical protein Patl1_19696 [Pistacia atlantica]|uniref:Uncharacterized protein n=1 Tax=Pistacia atlantica TaxID=434234 RepID=A0ACC1C387_9ROSI|nr:hypothetical protein Patl1_19696 [Pistacia atlantica]